MRTNWDEIAETRWGRYLIATEEAAIRNAHTLAGQPSLAIDLGCGSGRWSKLLASLGWRMTCIDVNEHALEVCKHNVQAARYVLADPVSRTIEAAPDSTALLLCIEVAPALEADWFIAELNRVCKLGAYFVGVHVNRRSWRGIACRLRYLMTGSPDGAVYYLTSYSDWSQKLKESGFSMVSEVGFCWMPFRRDSDSRLVPFFCRLERILGLHRWVSFSPWVLFVAKKVR